jgi:predicted RNA-binding Zn-ribbon protein involved in translation (DUF1610 family)
MTEEYRVNPLTFKASGLSCPRCGSSEIYIGLGMYGGRMYRCKQCGYHGAFVIEWDEGAPRPEYEPAPEYMDDEQKRSNIPLWITIAALLLTLFVLFLGLKF